MNEAKKLSAIILIETQILKFFMKQIIKILKSINLYKI